VIRAIRVICEICGLKKEIIENMANQVGKRYVCTVCGAEFIVTRGGDGELHCCGKKMEIKK
jgi:transposase-like protein